MSCNCSENKITESQIRRLARLIKEQPQLSDVDVEEGKMKDALGIPEDEQVEDNYTSGEELASDLYDAIGDEEEVRGMLAFAANIDPEENVFDSALGFVDDVAEEGDLRRKHATKTNRIREAVRSAIRNVLKEQNEYQEFFQTIMDTLEIDGLDDLDEDGKRKLFSYVESHWDEGESEQADEISKDDLGSMFDPQDFTGSAPDFVKGEEGVSETEIREAVRHTLVQMIK